MLSYREHSPSAHIAPFVKCFWTLRGLEVAPAPERILPDGSFELVFHFGDPFRAEGKVQARSLLVGEIRRPTVIEPARRVDVFGVRFRVGGARGFFRMPMSELRDAIRPLEEVARVDLDGARTTQERIDLLERLFGGETSPIVRQAIASIRRSGGQARAREVAQAVGVTDRTLERAFDHFVGMSPKVFSRLTRFRAYLESPALDEGYFDDSHLIRDFHEFSGTTPRGLERERNSINEAFVGNVQDGASRHR
jgi:AraC-like DNA-binding protein